MTLTGFHFRSFTLVIQLMVSPMVYLGFQDTLSARCNVC